jgi:hypothetical protein
MTSADKLQPYYDFDPEITEGLDRFEYDTAGMTFAELADQYSADEGRLITVFPGATHPSEIIMLRGVHAPQEKAPQIEYAAMAGPVDANAVYKMIVRHAVDPDRTKFLVGNPSGPGKPNGKLSFREAAKVATSADFSSIVEPILRFMQNTDVNEISHVGYSLGANYGLTAIDVSEKLGLGIAKSGLIEPAIVRGVQLPINFMKSSTRGEEFAEMSESQAYKEARNAMNIPNYLLGLLRVSNLAIGAALMRNEFVDQLEDVAKRYGDRITIVTGQESELSDGAAVQAVTNVSGMEHISIKNMPHAGGEFDLLHAAMMLQSTRQ